MTERKGRKLKAKVRKKENTESRIKEGKKWREEKERSEEKGLRR